MWTNALAFGLDSLLSGAVCYEQARPPGGVMTAGDGLIDG